jgi:uncharacterized protein (UPF0303 family)
MVGLLGVSGLPQVEDHAFLVEVIRELQARPRTT